MDGYDIQQWKVIERKLQDNGMQVEIKCDKFLLKRERISLAYFSKIDTLYSFLCGYETGLEFGTAIYISSQEV
jgi:hypothetical protein